MLTSKLIVCIICLTKKSSKRKYGALCTACHSPEVCESSFSSSVAGEVPREHSRWDINIVNGLMEKK